MTEHQRWFWRMNDEQRWNYSASGNRWWDALMIEIYGSRRLLKAHREFQQAMGWPVIDTIPSREHP